mmetsp:Transcript_11601/g.25118  ORF Transcript_11601/g.25118 Transcript_11601/m.25118 type:complete len:99 (-) Transcript_11601:368-664(-)|eukprot:CAMPEP_0172529226 /NCGR_PEP_ID=MMETSP1067-20121228/3362_1 /TAXON_ID=265564 ORGANISM="Thalassiosira punctigera, Strain Tpunct2005C2" /NCGR_SAMPLE_ID=MMETSP1067 /ASSEMBLY_ACC=CAM_ASM_000444 /LENGTH=98 /DNA_ID=CAMNT_0013313245 /DNA_START=118 /DNA_END=414 /DNA_ORIENTATION=+
MASRASKIAAVAREIFSTLPNRGRVRTGMQFLKKPLTGAYEKRYYMEPIEPYARRAQRACPLIPIYTSELQERRSLKLRMLRQRGKGPPKKGSGKRSK